MTQPPIVPWMPTEPTPKRRRWPWILAVLVVVLAGSGVGAFLAFRPQIKQVAAAVTQTKLRQAYMACGQQGEISDGDRTLFLDMGGTERNSGKLVLGDITCVLDVLKTPTYVRTHMDQTRALDGRQSDTWSNFEASWTYHPDKGLDILIREK